MFKIFIFFLIFSISFANDYTSRMQNNKMKYEGQEEVCEGKGQVKKTGFSKSNQCENLIANEIKKAKDEIEIVIYFLNNDVIVNAIKKAYKKGTKITMLVDKRNSNKKNSKVKELEKLGIPIYRSKKVAIEHNKFIVFDKINVITGSFNFTNTASKKNSENCILISDCKKDYHKRFTQLLDCYKNDHNCEKISYKN